MIAHYHMNSQPMENSDIFKLRFVEEMVYQCMIILTFIVYNLCMIDLEILKISTNINRPNVS